MEEIIKEMKSKYGLKEDIIKKLKEIKFTGKKKKSTKIMSDQSNLKQAASDSDKQADIDCRLLIDRIGYCTLIKSDV